MSQQGGLRVTELVAKRGTRVVLQGVSLEAPAGEVTALLGPNGAGKPTFVLALGGVIPLENGEVEYGGHSLAGARPDVIRGAGIAVVPEGRRLLRSLTVAENLQIAAYTMNRESARDGIAYALELFPELQKRWAIPTRLISGGEQQMVVLAQALVSRPSTLVIDELSLGLAPVVVQRLFRTLAKVRDSGVGILLIEQFAHKALAFSQGAYLLNHGRIEFAGTAEYLQRHPELMSGTYTRTSRGPANSASGPHIGGAA